MSDNKMKLTITYNKIEKKKKRLGEIFFYLDSLSSKLFGFFSSSLATSSTKGEINVLEYIPGLSDHLCCNHPHSYPGYSEV